MCSNLKVGSESVLEKPYRRQKFETESRVSVAFWKTKINTLFQCLFNNSHSHDQVLQKQTVMFTTVYDWWPAATIVRLPINYTAKPALHVQYYISVAGFYLICKIKPNLATDFNKTKSKPNPQFVSKLKSNRSSKLKNLFRTSHYWQND